MAKNKTDFAIVAGINSYPGLKDLEGPVNDATDFRTWLLDDDGGSVPPENIAFITSPSPPPAAIAAADAVPSTEDIEKPLRTIRALGNATGAAGHRLYIFLAGHGFTPDTREPALLAANADRYDLKHVPARLYADWFLATSYFLEVVLIMDCCRQRYAQVFPNFTWPQQQSPAGPSRRKFYGLGCQNVGAALEMAIPEDGNRVHGIFSWSLLQGLRGHAPRNDKGAVTSTTLTGFVKQYVSDLGKKIALSTADANLDPDINFSTFVDELVFSSPPPPAVNVLIKISPANQGKRVLLLDSALTVLLADQPTGDTWTFSVAAPGFYLVQLEDRSAQAAFTIPRAGGTEDARL